MVSSYDGQGKKGMRRGSVGTYIGAVSPAFLRRKPFNMQRIPTSSNSRNSILDAQRSALENQRRIFNCALTAARLGIWECALPSNDLEWTDVVYDMFDLPRGSELDRAEIVKCYAPASLSELSFLRTKAIAELSGFSMDAEISTKKGNRRWIRITATVESNDGNAIRIYGVKQDITEEKLMLDRMCYLAGHDVMTGLANRSEFQMKLAKYCSFGCSSGDEMALLLIDLDGFKTLNDTFGHLIGDDCLRNTAERLRAILGNKPHISRIGGDEFAVFLDCREDRRYPLDTAENIVAEMRRTITLGGVEVSIGASVGIAFANGSGPEDFFKRADAALYAAKNAGRDQFKIFEDRGELSMTRQHQPHESSSAVLIAHSSGATGCRKLSFHGQFAIGGDG